MWLARLWAHLHGRRYGDFMWCASGAHFYPLDPCADEVTIEDIARGLATECRYAGQIAIEAGIERIFYSVAEHSVLVSSACGAFAELDGWSREDQRAVALEGLLHDGSEAYVGDIIRPLKYQHAMRNYRRAEQLVAGVVEEAFDLRPTKRSRALVAEIDNRILVDEIEQLIASPNMNEVRRKYGRALGVEIMCWAPAEAEHQFLTRYFELTGLDAGTKRGAGA